MSEEHTDEVYENIDGFMTGPLDGFFSKYFGDAAADDVFQERVREICERNPLQGATTSIERFCHWMSSLAVENDEGARGSWKAAPLCRSGQGHETGLELSTHVAVAFTRSNPVSEPSDATVQVIGEFCLGQAISYKEGLLKLCARASSIFTVQPTRLFLHAFYLRGSWAELFVFDRCGPYTCNVFDVEKDFQRFVTVIWKYSSMTDAELGLSDLIKHDGMGPYIALKEDASVNKFASSTLRLAEQPLATPEELVSKATTCFKARLPGLDRWDYVVKFKWRLRDDIAEDVVIRHAEERNVWGLLSLDYFDQIIDTADLRSRLRHRPYRRFPSENDPKLSVQGGNSVESNTIETEKTFRVRTMVCIITSPCGRPLHTHNSVLELLQVLRDAVRGHRSLYADGGILHQDIAPGNIIISDSPDPGAPSGILIDLDVAMILEAGPRNPGGISITGTPPFMAVGALEGRPRTYRHDVESFLYVLLWAVISDGAVSPPGDSRLQGWRGGSYEGMAARKMVDMTSDGFRRILSEFAPGYRGLQELAQGFRQLLFPVRVDDERLSSTGTGTVGPRDEGAALYDGVLRLFDQAIDRYES
ncbi:hypothetical protein KVR01_008414 [Diaporthe batatas]|uniref:uncharacterized protein n=1 Tax=Diaporthe batatas TaxID=748121 RepID=UPI001D037192|nr:uncharacterized protein KVR01_008414 [Diaporthe batatas]KAG8161427.1 hypothetical protein KVR01_008414 [Diaporthe batatas]